MAAIQIARPKIDHGDRERFRRRRQPALERRNNFLRDGGRGRFCPGKSVAAWIDGKCQ